MHDINFRRPTRLSAGARVALIAPAGPVTEERITSAAGRCTSLGLEPVIGSAAHLRTGYLAGDDAVRARDVMWAFTDPHIDAVWALRGGYGTMRLHDHVDFGLLAAAGRPFIGFSDHTHVHLMLRAHGVVSYHGPHAGADFPPETQAAFLQVLFGTEPAGCLPLRKEDVAPSTLAAGSAEGILVGGNLSMLAAACGTPAQLQADGCILFVEDVGEAAYRLDRSFVQLELAGSLRGVRGFAFGRFTDLPAGHTNDEVVTLLTEIAAAYQVPAVYNFPIGHIEHNWTLPLGVCAQLDADACTLALIETATR